MSDRKVKVELTDSVELSLAEKLKEFSEQLNNTKEYSFLSFNCKTFAKEVFNKCMEIVNQKQNDVLENITENGITASPRTFEKSPKTPGRSLSPYKFITSLFSSGS